MGEGDIRIGVILGLSFGVGKLLLGFYYAIFGALLFALIVHLIPKRHMNLKSKIPFVPFLVTGGIAALFMPFDFFDVVNTISLSL